jgi:hypothetical protein
MAKGLANLIPLMLIATICSHASSAADEQVLRALAAWREYEGIEVEGSVAVFIEGVKDCERTSATELPMTPGNFVQNRLQRISPILKSPICEMSS